MNAGGRLRGETGSTDPRTRTDGGATVSREGGDRTLRVRGLAAPFRALALLSSAALLGSFLSVLYFVTDVVGATGWLLAVVAGALALSTLVANILGARSAFFVGVGLLVAGLGAYLSLVPSVYFAVVSAGGILGDTLALLTGLSVLRMTAAGTWALGVAPAPAFLTWYFTLRRRYVTAATVGGATLGFFVLTGDASPLVTLVGAVAAVALVGFGTLDRLGGTVKQVDALAVLAVAMVIAASFVSVVPGGANDPLAPGGGPTPTVEGSLLSAEERVSIVGSIRLSPKVRFTVEADRGDYWRAAAYDRYTGDGWVRSGGTRPMGGSQPPPRRAAYRVTQTFTAEAGVGTMPAAWKPVRVVEGSEGVRVSELGGLQPRGSLSAGDSYTVVSRVPDDNPETLQLAGTDYSTEVRERYLQLPDSTSDRLADRASEITADANTPYEKAVAIETWLEENKEYSLSVDRPDGNVADSFVFEMEAGYCTYYATSMVTMLRTQGVPARFVVGYSPGQRVGEEEWVVRGMNSHAWVEVYFPEVGWVRFDPTPSGPREEARQTQLAQSRAANETGVDAAGSEAGAWTPTPQEPDSAGEFDANGTVTGLSEDDLLQRLQPGGPGVVNRTEIAQTANGTATPPPTTDDESEGIPTGIPSRRGLAYALLALVGALAAGHYTGGLERAYRAIWLRWQRGRRDPETDVERAFRRLEYLLGREYRERRPEETAREYLDALSNVGLDDRAHRVGRLYERAAYAGSVSRADAEEAIGIVDSVVAERIGLLGD
jgi:transglutaminase-like putative cysteine protease